MSMTPPPLSFILGINRLHSDIRVSFSLSSIERVLDMSCTSNSYSYPITIGGVDEVVKPLDLSEINLAAPLHPATIEGSSTAIGIE